MSSRKGSKPSLQSLIKRMPSMRDRTRRRGSLGHDSGAVAIHDAVSKGKIHLAKFILDAVEDEVLVDVQDVHGKTPLIRAVRICDNSARNKVVDLLISYGARVNLCDNVGRSALSYACELHCNEEIRKLVKNNVDPNLEDNNGNTPLMYCAMVNNAEGIHVISRSFRRLGLEVDKFNAEGMTPLMEAAKRGYMECARLLAGGAKASVFAKDFVRNMNAAEWALESGCTSPEVEALLPKKRACIQATRPRASSLGKASFDLEMNALPSLVHATGHQQPKSISQCHAASGNGAPSGRFVEDCRRDDVSLEEFSYRFKELQLNDRVPGAAANMSSFPDVFNPGRQHVPVEGLHEIAFHGPDPKGGFAQHSGVNSPPPCGALRRPQPPAFPARPYSTAQHRPARRMKQAAAGRSSNSMEDLLLMGGITAPPSSAPSVHKSSSLSHLLLCQQSEACEARGVNRESHIALQILAGESSEVRRRSSSEPVPSSSYPQLSSEALESLLYIHLPPISSHQDNCRGQFHTLL